MARYTGPKDRLSRREGVDLFGKGSKLTRLSVPPGQHGPKGARRLSEYGTQLREKQKMKRMYGILEKQFASYVKKAMRKRGNTGETLLALLERRLDNTVYRLGFAATRAMARQLVSHGHVFVNGGKVDVPSYQVREGDVVSLTTKACDIPVVKKLLTGEGVSLPSWLERKAAAGKIKSDPKRQDVVEPVSEQDVVEFYSR